jgi:hypothetical protein
LHDGNDVDDDEYLYLVDENTKFHSEGGGVFKMEIYRCADLRNSGTRSVADD